MGIFVFIEVTFDFPRLYPLGTYMRSWNKAFTCHENHAKQTTWINEYQTQESRCELLRQRAIYLQEDVDALQKIPEKDIAPEQVQQLQSLEEELAQVKQQYWSGRQTLGDLLVRKPRGGARIREFELRHQRRKSVSGRRTAGFVGLEEVVVRGTMNAVRGRRRIYFVQGKVWKKKTHCSVACGCCVRSRGIYGDDTDVRG